MRVGPTTPMVPRARPPSPVGRGHHARLPHAGDRVLPADGHADRWPTVAASRRSPRISDSRSIASSIWRRLSRRWNDSLGGDVRHPARTRARPRGPRRSSPGLRATPPSKACRHRGASARPGSPSASWRPSVRDRRSWPSDESPGGGLHVLGRGVLRGARSSASPPGRRRTPAAAGPRSRPDQLGPGDRLSSGAGSQRQ